jgi:hypothetical protein
MYFPPYTIDFFQQAVRSAQCSGYLGLFFVSLGHGVYGKGSLASPFPGGTRRESVSFSYFMGRALGIVYGITGLSSAAHHQLDAGQMCLGRSLSYGLLYLYQPDSQVIEIADSTSILILS